MQGLSDRHVHDVLVSAKHLVSDVQSELEAKRRYLLVDHHFADVILHAHFIGLDQASGPALRRRNLIDGIGYAVTEALGRRLLSFQPFLGAFEHLCMRGAKAATNGSDGAHLTLPFNCNSGLRRALAESVAHGSLQSLANIPERIVNQDVGRGDGPVLGKNKRALQNIL